MGFADTDLDYWELFLVANIVTVITMVFCLISIWMFHVRKHCFPIQGRGSTAILLAAWIFFTLLFRTVFRGPYFPCVVDIAIYVAGSHCGCAIYLYRVAVLLARHSIAREATLTVPLNSVRKRRSFVHGGVGCQLLDTKLWGIVLLGYGILVFFAVLLVAFLSGDDWRCQNGRNKVVNNVTLVSNLGLLLVLSPLFAWMSCKLRKYPADGRRIATEFRIVGVSMCGGFIVFIAASQIPSNIDVPSVALYFMAFVGVSTFGSSLCYPVYLTYQYPPPDTSSTRASTACTIDELLTREEFRSSFLNHLKTEFNAESLMFWQSVTDFKAKGQRDTSTMTAEILEISSLYIERNAPYQLNVSDETMFRTKAIIQRACDSGTGYLEVFDEVLAEVVTLLKNDPLPRFFRTPAGLPFLEAQENASRA